MSSTIVDELVTLLGYRLDSNAHPTLAKFSQAVESVGKIASVAAASVTAAAASLLYFAEKSAAAGAEIERFHQLTGMSTDNIQQWSYAAQQVSGSKDSIIQDIAKITEGLNPILPQQFNSGLFMMFGSKLQSIKDVNQAFREMAKIFPTLSPQKAMQWGNLIGITPETVMMLRQGEDRIDRLMNKVKGRILSPKETEESLKFAQVWSDIHNNISRFSEHVAIKLFPIIERVVNKMTKWWEINQQLIYSGLNKFVEGVSDGIERFLKGIERLKSLTPFIQNILEMFLDPRIISGTVTAALTGIAVALGIIAAKYVLIGAVIMTAIGALEAFKDPESWVNRKRWEEYSGRPDWIKKLTPDWAVPKAPGNPGAPMPAGPLDSLKNMIRDLSMAPAAINNTSTTGGSALGGSSPAGGSAQVVQHNQMVEIHVDGGGKTTYATSDEAIRKLNSIPRTDYKTMGPVAPVN